MELWTEILSRGAGMLVFTVAVCGFAYWITQIAPERAERREARRGEKK